MPANNKNGFTLIELSIVLVIIGLIVGGILIGKDLIETAALRSQIGQINTFASASRAFQTKYNCLPGDCANPSQFGMFSTGMDGTAGKGDGNGLLEEYHQSANCPYLLNEITVFWRHLSDAGMIPSLGQGLANMGWLPSDATTYDQVALYLPVSKINNTAFVTVYSQRGKNRMQLLQPIVPSADGYAGSPLVSTTGNYFPGAFLKPSQASYIDTKIDDGIPLTGNVLAQSGIWSSCISWPATNTECITTGTTPATYLSSTGNCELSFPLY